MHVFHCHAAPELVHMYGLRDNNLLGRRLRGVLAIRFPYKLRVGEPITAVVQTNDLNIAATVRSRVIETKTLVTILAGAIGTATGGEAEAQALFANLSSHCPEASRIVHACFQEQEMGKAIAFTPGVIKFAPESHMKGGEPSMMNEDKVNVVQFVVHEAGAIADSSIEAVGPGVSDQKYRVRKAVKHGEDAEVWYQVLFTVEPTADDPVEKIAALLKSA